MLKYAVVLVLAIAFIEARPGKRSGSGSGSGSGMSHERPLLTAMAFREDLTKVKDMAAGMSKSIANVKELAEKALGDPNGNGWEEFEMALTNMFMNVGQEFGAKVDHMTNLAESIFEGHNTFVKDDKCGFVAAVDEKKEVLDNLELDFVLAMLEDLGCMSAEFAKAEGIPVEKLKGDLHEDDAIQFVVNALWEMKKIGRAGELFGQSLQSVVEYLEMSKKKRDEEAAELEKRDFTTDSPDMTTDVHDDKRALSRLLRIMEKYSR